MKKFSKGLSILLAVTMLLCLFVSVGSSATGTRDTKLTLRLGCLGSGREDDMQSYPIARFKELVEERTGGMVEIEVFPDGQLGGEPDMMDQVLAGSLDCGVLSANVLATVWQELYVYNLPFAFNDLTEFWAVCGLGNPAFVDEITGVVDGSGKAKFVSSFAAEFRGCQNSKHAIRSPQDFKGLTFRVMAGEIFTDIFRALGASTATVPFGELYTALQQGVVDGEDIGFSMFFDNKLYEVEKFATQFNITPTVNCLIFSNGAWDKLTEEERDIVYGAALEAEQYCYEVVDGTLSKKHFDPMAEQGVEVIRHEELTAEELQACRDAVQTVWDKFEPIIGEKVYSAFVSSVEKVRAGN